MEEELKEQAVMDDHSTPNHLHTSPLYHKDSYPQSKDNDADHLEQWPQEATIQQQEAQRFNKKLTKQKS